MANYLFNKYGNMNQNHNTKNGLLAQLAMVKNNPGAILDVMLQNGKINQQQYNDLQQYRNNPEAIVKYLLNNGKNEEINQAQQLVGQFMH